MSNQDHRLISLLQRAVYIQQQQWMVMSLIESHISFNNGLKDAEVDACYEAVRVLSAEGDELHIEQEQAEFFMQQVAKVHALGIKCPRAVAPLSYDEFVRQYTAAYTDAGDEVPGDLTSAYAVYCSNPAGHFLHKE